MPFATDVVASDRRWTSALPRLRPKLCSSTSKDQKTKHAPARALASICERERFLLTLCACSILTFLQIKAGAPCMKRDLACSNQLDRPRIVKKRCFFYLPGYELISSAGVHRRFATELERFRSTWCAAATVSPPKPAQDGFVSWRIESRGPNWRVDTDVTLLDWSDVLFADFSQPPWRIVSCGLAAMLDFFLSGTIIGYLRTNWRYLLFYVYPIFLLCTFCATGFVVAWFVIAHGIPWPSALGPLLGVFCVALLVRWSGRRLHLYYSLLDWRFAVSIVRRSRPEFEEKLDRFARTFAEIARASTADEIVIFGHSLGAVMMIQIMARALRHDQCLLNASNGSISSPPARRF